MKPALGRLAAHSGNWVEGGESVRLVFEFAPASKEYPPAVHQGCTFTLLLEIYITDLLAQSQTAICECVDKGLQRSMLGGMRCH